MKKTKATKAWEPSFRLPAAGYSALRCVVCAACALALVLSLLATHLETQRSLRKTCQSVTQDFSAIMESYRHSFRLFEKLLQQEILHVQDPDEIERFLKQQDKSLLAIEGADYDGVYLYYQGRYLYSWDTPYAVYRDSGYDATTRPWYIGAVAAEGELFFSVPYPSYANDYMLATISRLQADGETVIAYDIKLGEIGKFVDRLELYDGALTLICDREGNIIGSTNHQYLGGDYSLTHQELEAHTALARQELETAHADNRDKAEQKVLSAEAQEAFFTRSGPWLATLLARSGTLRYSLAEAGFGFAWDGGAYTCFVLAPLTKLLPRMAVLWAALSFLLTALGILLVKILGKNSQILTDVLTGLNNRRAFIKYCDNHIQHRPEENLCLLMLDLNEFKNINDRFGHIVGDQALLDTANVLKQACGDAPCNLFLCRYGGDEFLLAGAGCSQAQLNQTRALINARLAEKNQTGNSPYVLEASAGTAIGTCRDRASLDQLLQTADQAMYQEKLRMKRSPKV